MTRAEAVAALALLGAACARVPEQALRDEQAKSRAYRDAYETQAAELQALKDKLAASAGQKQCEGSPAAASAPAH